MYRLPCPKESHPPNQLFHVLSYLCLGLNDVLNSVYGSVIHARLIWIPNFLQTIGCCLRLKARSDVKSKMINGIARLFCCIDPKVCGTDVVGLELHHIVT